MDTFVEFVTALWNWFADAMVAVLEWDLEDKFPDVYTIVSSVNSALVAVGQSFCLIFFLYGIAQSLENVHEIKPAKLTGHCIRYVVANAAVHYSTSILMWFWDVSVGVISLVTETLETENLHITFDDAVSDALEELFEFDVSELSLLDIFGGIGKLIGMQMSKYPLLIFLIITCLSVLLVGVAIYIYLLARFLRILVEVALAPIGLCFFGSEKTSHMGITYIKGFAGDCLFGVALTCVLYIFAAFMGTDVFDLSEAWSGFDGILLSFSMWEFCITMLLKVVLFALMVFGTRTLVKEKFNM